MTESSEGLRARNRRLRHRAIEDAALRLFAAQGFAATTVDQIADAAGVSPRTFFHYFASKEDVVLGDFELRFARLAERLESRLTDGSPSEAIRRALLDGADDYERERDRILQRVELTTASPQVRARFLEHQSQWEDRIRAAFAGHLGGVADSDPRPWILAAVTLGALRIALRRWVAGGGVDPLPVLIAETLELFDRGAAHLEPPG